MKINRTKCFSLTHVRSSNQNGLNFIGKATFISEMNNLKDFFKKNEFYFHFFHFEFLPQKLGSAHIQYQLIAIGRSLAVLRHPTGDWL